ncbi:MAG: DUF4097 family beta strand repeat-containing protein [Gemmatimonadales bacterium]|jgi:DUF4097 and DUF4098 domain-containing protein YvlB
MYSALMLGALTAIASPQEPEKKVEIDLQPHTQVEAVELPAFDFYLPSFSFEIPSVEFYGGDFEIHTAWVDIPAIEIAIPEVAFDLPLADDWYGDRASHVQDMDMDTTFEVNPNATLRLRNHAGEIVIRTWDRSQVRVEASYSSDDRVKIFASSSAVDIKSETRHGHPDVVDYEVTIPRSMSLDLWGLETDITVDGVQDGVRAETMSGDVEVRDAVGTISVRSVEGDISLIKTRGRIEANGVEGDVTVVDFEGELRAESIDGEIVLDDIRSGEVYAKTVDGDISYQGELRDDGRYHLTTHDGDVVVAVPENANATVSVATFEGEFEADFPVRLEGAEGRRKFSFVIGNGGAQLELHSFDGDIRLIVGGDTRLQGR